VADALLQAYNDVPYTSAPDPARHPERLATLGTLLGLDVAPVATCRVLELACGDGANLVSIASTFPDATFVGFDFAAAPIARAQRMVRELGLTNVRVLELDLREIPRDLGTFDYIIAHGLYSWIPAEVRAHVIPLVARHLAPNGVALVSYNAMPGCHMRGIVWDLLKYHTRDIPDKSAKVAAARALLDLVATPVDGDTPSQQAMRAEVGSAAKGSDASLAHDELSEPNNPFYFHEFIDDAGRAGLTFLAEARLDTMLGAGLAPQVRQALGRLDRLAREQYLDFVQFRHFRESLLCHANAPTRFVLQPARVLGLHVLPSLALRREAAMRPAAQGPASTADPLEQWLLSRWPRSVSVAELGHWRDAQASASAGANASQPIEQLVAELYAASRVDLRTTPVAVAVAGGERPEAFGAARWLNREHEVIPSLYHEALRYQDPLGRKLLALLDGTRTRDELCAALGGPFGGPAGRVHLDGALRILASKALLVR
jgi:SAM-dependent methyltransferase